MRSALISSITCKLVMKLLVFAGILLFTRANPVPKRDVGSSYNYKPPATSYGVPSGSVGGSAQNEITKTDSTEPEVASVSPDSFTTDTQGGTSETTPSSVSFETSSVSPFTYSTTPVYNFELPNREFSSFTGNVQSVANIPLGNAGISDSVLANRFLQNAGNGQTIQNIPLNNAGISNSVLNSQFLQNRNIDFGNVPNVFLTNDQNLGQFNIQSLGGGFPAGAFGSQANFNAAGILPGSFGLQPNLNAISNINTNVESNANYNTGETGGEDLQSVIDKHLYFYSAPEDLQIPARKINLPRDPPKKNVKILFIKAPAVVTPPPIVIPAQKQNEEKTVVYVLVKKPEEAAPIEIDTPPTTPPSKPDVFFIKYKNQEEAEKIVSTIQSKNQKEGSLDSRSGPIGGNIQLQGVQNVQNLPQGFIGQNPLLFRSGAIGGAPNQGDLTSYAGSVSPGIGFGAVNKNLQPSIQQQTRLLEQSFNVPNNSGGSSSSVLILPNRTSGGSSSVEESNSDNISPNGSSSSASVSVPASQYGVPNKNFLIKK